MNTNVAVREARSAAGGLNARGTWTRYLVPLGRAAFAAVFLWFAPADFSPQGIVWAAHQHVPLPQVLAPLAGLISLAGGVSILLGYRARLGAWLLVLFLVPVTLMVHNFWAVQVRRWRRCSWGFSWRICQGSAPPCSSRTSALGP